MSVTVSPAAAKRPSEWATTPVTTSAVARATLRPSTIRRRSSRLTPSRLRRPRVFARSVVAWTTDRANTEEIRPLPAQLTQTRVADPEVVGHLVDDGAPYLLDDLLLGVA